MIITGVGHYVSLVAEGPGSPLWYSESGAWVAAEDQRKVFTGVQSAVRTPIVGLPPGYRAHLVCSEVTVLDQERPPSWGCCCP